MDDTDLGTQHWSFPHSDWSWNGNTKVIMADVDDPLTKLLHHKSFEQLRPNIAGAARLPDDVWALLVRLRSRPEWPTSKSLILNHAPSSATLDNIWHSLPHLQQPFDLNVSSQNAHALLTTPPTVGNPLTSSKRQRPERKEPSTSPTKRQKKPSGPYACPHAPKCQGRRWKKFGMFRRHLLMEHDIRIDDVG